MQNQFRVVTDTATLCVFDPQMLKHRVDDVADWWSIESDEIDEINLGNVFFIGLGSDGMYEVIVHDGIISGDAVLTAKLKCASGRLFIGPGECVSSGGFEPAVEDGLFLDVKPGSYLISVSRVGYWRLEVGIEWTEKEAGNSFHSSPRLEN